MAGLPNSPNTPPGVVASPQSPTTANVLGETPTNLGSPAVVQENNTAIAVDENAADESLDLDDNASSSASITSSIMRYRHENGRRYHAYKDGLYAFHNDDPEAERLDLQHHMFRRTFDEKLFLCPADPKKLHHVLDCGTGTGIWAIEMGDQVPNAQIIGTDLSAIQPDFVPPNVAFYVDDVEDDWTYDYTFDLIYARMLTGSIVNFPRFFKQCFDFMTPGGHVELLDVVFPLESLDGTLSKDSALYQWSAYCLEASDNMKRRGDSAKHYAKQMADVGFINIVERKIMWPLNHWPKDPGYKEMGVWMYENMGKNLSGLTLALFTRGLGWSAEQVEVFLVDVRKQWKDPRIHACMPIYVVYGQKPAP